MKKQPNDRTVSASRLGAVVIAASCAAASLSLLAACDSADSNKTVGQKIDNAVAHTEAKAEEVKDATRPHDGPRFLETQRRARA